MSPLNELEVMKIIEESLSKIADEETKNRILEWAVSKFSSKEQKKQRTKPATKKQKSSLSIVKNLVLSPKDKISFEDFINEKQPKSDQEKCVVSVFHMQHNLELENIDVNHVYTCYKVIKWRVPADLENTLTVLASQKGWLNTSNLKDIKTTPHGENLIEYDLPKKAKIK